ncbi:MAG TPA: 3-phosphoshikimate 1-carboxyvinyltransferase [Gemmatimonadales bacterium]|nr:3-phosphoshikimate 1-carboxyvinyltransferase [Gemmatimonadales bacterium]
MRIDADLRVPGDKSITHRALILAAMAPGESRIGGALTSFDARSTARVLRQLGAVISPLAAGRDIVVRGRPRFRRPGDALHCGNSGTSARILLGVLSAHRFSATLTGDPSLRRRPMRRVTDPLALMGARFEYRGPDGLPVTVRGGALTRLRYELPVSSAQLKSALLLAGVVGQVVVELREPAGRSRDHTERMLRSCGYDLDDDGEWIRFAPTGQLEPMAWEIPGDPSSAAFLVGAALLGESGSLRLRGVGLNPTRTGFLRVLTRMGAGIQVEELREVGGEPVGDLVVAPCGLTATDVAPAEIPGLIDEIPLLSVLASRAEGTTVFREVGELRVKESDRLALLARNLRAVGAGAEAVGNTLTVVGGGRPPAGRVVTEGDHRLAMAFAVLGTLPGARVRVDDPDAAGVSYPGFHAALTQLKGRTKGAG